MKTLFTASVLLIATSAWAQIPKPGEMPAKAMVLTGGIAHIGNGDVLENAAIGIENGKITFVKPMGSVKLNPETADIIDITAKHVYPGFISPNNTLGLTEIDAVRASNDYAETGSFNPEVRAVTSFNTDSRISPTVRSNGVLITQATPRSGRICGTSAVMHLDGWNWEDAALKADDGIHVNWPNRFQRSGWWAEPGPTKANEKYDEQVNELRTFLLRAKAYTENPSPEFNQKMAACKGLFNGSQNLYLHVNDAKGIMESVLFAESVGAKKPVIVGATEAWLVVDFLSSKNIPVILERTHSLPANTDDHVDQPFKSAKALFDSKILFCFDYAGDMEAMGSRNLPFTAGTAVAHGLKYEEAVKSITLNAAKILGVDKSAGSLETGKDATLFVSNGDALDMITNDVTHAWIQGKPVDLDNPQKFLYRKFKEKSEN
ncbi:MAG: amidohydrolase family protein [Flavobacteriales bacterium]|nr:amidohydrolase family protein [Flavobacteriales bacterium]